MKLKVTFVDAFTNEVFKGNPAAVIILDEWLDEQIMQLIATENNLAETAFLVRYETNAYHIRWFSPITEIDFCGHATLASALVLFNANNAIDAITFTAKAVGDLAVKKGDNGLMEMCFPNRKPEKISEIPSALISGLSLKPQEVYLSQQAYFAVYASEQEVTAITQDSQHLKMLAPYDVVATAPASASLISNVDFISRYFWPANGGDEDSVTGSIHAGLAPLWAEKLGKLQLSAYQASTRGGHLFCRVDGDQVFISGHAVQYLEGSIDI